MGNGSSFPVCQYLPIIGQLLLDEQVPARWSCLAGEANPAVDLAWLRDHGGDHDDTSTPEERDIVERRRDRSPRVRIVHAASAGAAGHGAADLHPQGTAAPTDA